MNLFFLFCIAFEMHLVEMNYYRSPSFLSVFGNSSRVYHLPQFTIKEWEFGE